MERVLRPVGQNRLRIHGLGFCLLASLRRCGHEDFRVAKPDNRRISIVRGDATLLGAAVGSAAVRRRTDPNSSIILSVNFDRIISVSRPQAMCSLPRYAMLSSLEKIQESADAVP